MASVPAFTCRELQRIIFVINDIKMSSSHSDFNLIRSVNMSAKDALKGMLQHALRLYQNGQTKSALQACEQILINFPLDAQALHLSGLIAVQNNQPTIAIELIRLSLNVQPSNVSALYDLGIVLSEMNRLEEALQIFDELLSIKPDCLQAIFKRGNLLQILGRYNDALLSYDQILTIDLKSHAAYINRGIALKELNRFEEALASYDKAIAIDAENADAYSNRGNVLQKMNRMTEALFCYDKAIEIQPDHADAYSNRGNVLQALKRLDDAIDSYDKSIELNPNAIDPKWNKGLALLLKGDYQRGFDLYELRFMHKKIAEQTRSFSQPLWLGDSCIAGLTILLHAEQGLGDTIQFCRYAINVKALGARVVMEVPASLIDVLQCLPCVDEWVARGQSLPHFDLHCPLMSLPLAFNTNLTNIPSPRSYIQANSARSRFWSERMGNIKKLKVGLVWHGGFRVDQPKTWNVNAQRNVHLYDLAQALKNVDVLFYSLQKGEPAESEIKNREAEFWPNDNFINFTDEIKDFSDTAGLIANLDLVVSVDTSTAHLAAAMGKPTWILNRHDTCWRWLLDRDDSPWYESVTLYRQDSTRTWQPVLNQIAHDLQHKSACHASSAHSSS